MLVEAIRETVRAMERDTLCKVSRVSVGKSAMDAVWLEARAKPGAVEKSKNAKGMRVVVVAGLEIRERPWEITKEVRFEVG